MVLVLVLVVIALLTLACFTFSKLMLTERKAALVSSRQAQARALADSGLEMARVFLAMDSATQDELGGWYDNETEFCGVPVVDDGQGEDVGRFTIVAPQLIDGIAQGIRFGLEDESTRLNLSTLLAAEKSVGKGGRELLMGLPGMSEEIADSILDWIDEDDLPREFGAEVEYYSALDPPYAPKNGPLDSVEELLLVRGVTPWLLFGVDANRNGQADSDEPDPSGLLDVDNSEGSMNRGWAAYLTLYSLEMNLNPDGKEKIDLNQDDLEKLHNALKEVVDEEWATFIVAFRQNGPYESEEGKEEEGESDAEGELDFSKKGSHEFSDVLELIGPNVKVKFKDQPKETLLATPFPEESGEMDSYLPKLMDHVAVNAAPLIPGRININQAPRAVLMGIPGIDENTVEAILAQREPNPTEANANRCHETWILTEGIITLEEMRALLPFVTGGGCVYRAQVVGYFDRGGPAARVEAVLDATAGPGRIVFFRDLSHLGRGYSLETLGANLPGQ